MVLNTGGPALMPWLRPVAGVLEAWYPGQQNGTAIAAVLFGDANPSGKLPVTFPRSDQQGPAPDAPSGSLAPTATERYDEGLARRLPLVRPGGQQPLFPFGYGLSYTSFRLRRAALDVGRRAVSSGERAEHGPARRARKSFRSTLARPLRASRRSSSGYRKVALEPGECRRVRLRLRRGGPRGCSTGWGACREGRYAALVGTSSRDLPLRKGFFVG